MMGWAESPDVESGLPHPTEPQETSLLAAFCRLPLETASELSGLSERLAATAPDRKIDWSDSWSDEDLEAFRAASLRGLRHEFAAGVVCVV